MAKRDVAVAIAALTVLLPVRARAQEQAPSPRSRREPFSIQAHLGAGWMATDDQRNVLRLDQAGGLLRVAGTAGPFVEVPWIEGELSLGALLVGAATGTPGVVLDVNLGVRATPTFERVGFVLAVSGGVGVTGPFVVPTFHAELGALFEVSAEWSVGPLVSLTHVVWTDAPQQTSDAIFPTLGVHIVHRIAHIEAPAVEPEPAPEPIHGVPPFPDADYEPYVPPPPADNQALFELIDRAVPAPHTRVTTELVPPLLFDHNTTSLSSCGEASLYDVLEAVDHAPPDARIIIEGHADGTGDPDYNRELSLRRAEEVRGFLLAHHVDAARIEVRAVGEEAPLVVESTDRALSLNRRVLVLIERLVPNAPPPQASPSSTPAETAPATSIEPVPAPSPIREGASS